MQTPEGSERRRDERWALDMADGKENRPLAWVSPGGGADKEQKDIEPGWIRAWCMW